MATVRIPDLDQSEAEELVEMLSERYGLLAEIEDKA